MSKLFSALIVSLVMSAYFFLPSDSPFAWGDCGGVLGGVQDILATDHSATCGQVEVRENFTVQHVDSQTGRAYCQIWIYAEVRISTIYCCVEKWSFCKISRCEAGQGDTICGDNPPYWAVVTWARWCDKETDQPVIQGRSNAFCFCSGGMPLFGDAHDNCDEV